jgi:hypothetical protein
MNETPLIWTSKGNVPIASLKYEHKWIDTPEETTLHEMWYAEDGELVKNNVHMFGRKQLIFSGSQAAMA